MIQVRSQWTELLTRDMYKYMFEEYDQLPTVFSKIFEVENITSAYVKETTAIGMGQLTERKEGSRIISSNPLEGFTAVGKARTWSDGFEVTMEMDEDTPPEKIANFAKSVASSWAEGVVQSQETFTANFFNYGGYTSGHDIFNNTITGVVDDDGGDLIYDGKPFFALSGNNHTNKAGSTYYNGLALALTGDNLQTAYNLMTVTNNYNERGQKVSIKPDTLLIPPNLRFTAKTILESERVPGNANNDINAVQNIVEPIEWEYLTDTDAWFLGKRLKGIKVLNRRIPIIEFYKNPETKAIYVTIDARWGAFVKNWRYWLGSNFSTS